MSQISSSVGIISGIPIEETVEQLMEVAARPRELLESRNESLQAEALAIDKLSSLVLALQFDGDKLKSPSLFNQRTASSSDQGALSASVPSGSSPAAGNYVFTPVQTASAQQLLSQSFETGEPIGAGSFSFRNGGFVDPGLSLDALNAGMGIDRGEIRITDRSGESTTIDLRYARTVDDVLDAINNNGAVNVTAEAVGDTFRITDNTGQSSSNLIVQEVAGGTTAASLGLDGINVAGDSATGSDVLALSTSTRLATLNDGNGVRLIDGADDLEVSFADGTTLTVDLSGASSVGDVLEEINEADSDRLAASIAADGSRLELTDLTTGGGTFAVSSVGSGTAAEDLGLTTTAAGDTITGSRLQSGLRDVLVSSLGGGQGLGTLGTVDITNRDGVSFSVDLSGAETLGQMVAAFNAQATDVNASINASRSGILLTDTTGASAANFTVADGDGHETASALGLVADTAATTVDSGSLGRQTVSEATLLSSLNGGAGVALGDLQVIDSNGDSKFLDLNSPDDPAQTVGDVIDAINAAGNGVLARINDAGDGILLVDTAEGSDVLTVAEVGNGRMAADLGLLGTATEVDLDGTPTFVIDGTGTKTVEIGEEDTLADVVETINGLGAGVTASIVNDGTGQRLSLTTNESGAASELQLDTAGSPLVFQEISAARDAILQYGTSAGGGTGILVGSSSNTFDNVIDGLELTVENGTKQPVTVSVSASSSKVTTAAQDFVDAFNSVRTELDTVTEFNEEELTTGILFGTGAALRVESDLNRLLSGRINGVGELDSLAAVGIEFDDTGRLSLDESALAAAYEQNPAALEQLFADEEFGLVARLDTVIERLATADNSALSSRGESLTRKIELNSERITSMNEQLERQRERLYSEFYALESVVAKFQENIAALENFQPVPPMSVGTPLNGR